MRNIVSVVMGAPVARLRLPYASRLTTFPCRTSMVTIPATWFWSTAACMALVRRRSLSDEKPTLSGEAGASVTMGSFGGRACRAALTARAGEATESEAATVAKSSFERMISPRSVIAGFSPQRSNPLAHPVQLRNSCGTCCIAMRQSKALNRGPDARQTLDIPHLCRALECCGIERTLPWQPRQGTDGPFHCLRSADSDGLRQRRSARNRRGGQGRRARL